MDEAAVVDPPAGAGASKDATKRRRIVKVRQAPQSPGVVLVQAAAPQSLVLVQAEASSESSASGAPVKRHRVAAPMDEASVVEPAGATVVSDASGIVSEPDVAAPIVEPAGATVVSGASGIVGVGAPVARAPEPAPMDEDAPSGLLSWFTRRLSPGEGARHQVDRGVPPVSAPRNLPPTVVEDENGNHPLGEVSFDTAEEGDDDFSGVTNIFDPAPGVVLE
jgi:hypothetical protein